MKPLTNIFLLVVCSITGLVLSLECNKKQDVVVSNNCLRRCEFPKQPRICEYTIEAKWFYSMSGFCFDCPINIDDCDREQCVPLDGVSRPVVVTNGTIPGPSIQVCEGDTVRVKLLNHLQDHGSLTIHWYGMHQEGTNWMDGASMITQCPVASSSSFVYEFKASPAGTHWWHGHSGYERDDGMYGSLIVRQAKEAELNSNMYNFDLPEHVMMIADWKSRPALSTYLMTDSPTCYVDSEAQNFSILVNGKAAEVPFVDDNGKTFYTPLSKFEVQGGMTYRFRVISAAFALCNLQVSIQSHPLTIIAVDGAEVKPRTVDSFIIAPGERYDFVLEATAKPAVYCIYMVGTESSRCIDDGVAILKYTSSSETAHSCLPVPSSPPSLTDTEVFSVVESQPLAVYNGELDTVDVKYYLALTYVVSEYFTDDGRAMDCGGLLSWFIIDNVSFKYPSSPMVSSKPVSVETCEPNKNEHLYYKCGEHKMCNCTSILKLPLHKVVEFIIINLNVADYSVHMHGDSFRVLAMGTIGEEYSITKKLVKELDNEGLLTRISPEDAIIKDTVNVPAVGYSIVRWKTSNPGYWFFHAQTNSHLETGQAVILQVGTEDDMVQPPSDLPTCGPWSPK